MVDWEQFYAHFRQPDFLAGYEIGHRLGSGAFGEVYEATKLSIGKRYAVKFLKVGGEAESRVVEREIAQAKLFASLDHPNLVAIEDVGLVQGVPYVIMGHAGEDTLARRLERGPLPLDQAFRIFVQVCRGVLALHDRNLAHFDLKPSNVFLRGETARVGDYGLSKLLSDGRNTLSFGRGTPRYMAPEMLSGRADHRADVFSLGVLLFEALTGELPFETDSALGLLQPEPEPLPRFPPDFPVALRGPVERCLRRDPEQRYPSVAALLDELGQAARRNESIALPLADGAPDPVAEAAPLRSASALQDTASAPGDVLEWQTLGEAPDPLQGPDPAHGAERAPRSAPWSDRPARGLSGGPAAVDSAGARPPALPARTAVLPVPPAVRGGVVATLVAMARVGIELFAGMVVLPLRVAAGWLRPALARVGGWLASAGSLVWFAVLSFGAGALLLLLLLVWGSA